MSEVETTEPVFHYERKPSFPPEIAAAIIKVMADVTTLARDGRNEHERYNYASVDAFYDFLRPKLAKHGLFVLADELEREVVPSPTPGKSPRLRILYAITIGHASGATYQGIEREVMVVASGPQAYASAQSFVVKYFLRSLFMVPTGEADADEEEATPLPITPAKPRQTKQLAAQNATEERLKDFIQKVSDFLDGSPDPDALFEFEGKNAAAFKRMREAYKGRPDVAPLLERIEGIYEQARRDKPSEQE